MNQSNKIVKALEEHGVKIIHDTRTCATCFLLAVPECASDDFNAQADKLLGEVDK